MDFPFSFTALLYTTVLLFVLYLFTLLRSSFRISFSTPMALLQKGHEGEGEPKSRVILSFIGFLFLGIGYGIALLIQGLLSSFTYFFLAVLAVILATYLLYISFSVLLLKMEKRRPSYYKPEKFLKHQRTSLSYQGKCSFSCEHFHLKYWSDFEPCHHHLYVRKYSE